MSSEEKLAVANNLDYTIRFVASFDMGWQTRGTGRSYGKLSGFACSVGYFSKKIISYVELNRKCKKCDMEHPPNHESCRKNFFGIAKAMESRAAVILSNKNKLLKECNMQIGMVICDNDGSILSAMNSCCDYDIFKESDKNHTSKGVASKMYRIKNINQKNKDYKELNSNTIKYFKKCFNYAVSQNASDPVKLVNNFRAIPLHAFNNHDKCNISWCGFMKDPDNYKHTNIGDGLQSEVLQKDLVKLFEKLAENAAQFLAGLSSNSNDSLNHTQAKYSLKDRMYGTSSSGAIRDAFTVLKKM